MDWSIEKMRRMVWFALPCRIHSIVRGLNALVLVLSKSEVSMKIQGFCPLKHIVLLMLLIPLWSCAQQSDSLLLDDMTLHYHQYGLDQGDPILLLTGGPGNAYGQLEEMALELSGEHRVILPEQRGTGKSLPSPLDSTTVTLEKVTGDLDRLLDSLALEKITVIGHSWGGMLAMHFAATYPGHVQKLVLVGPGPHKKVRKGYEILTSNFYRAMGLGDMEQLQEYEKSQEGKERMRLEPSIEMQRSIRKPYAFIRPLPDSLFQKMSVQRNTTTTELLVKEIMEVYDVSESLRNYTGEIHIITGRQDIVDFCSYEIKLDIPGTQLHWIEECGHFPMYERPDIFYRVLGTVLQAGE